MRSVWFRGRQPSGARRLRGDDGSAASGDDFEGSGVNGQCVVLVAGVVLGEARRAGRGAKLAEFVQSGERLDDRSVESSDVSKKSWAERYRNVKLRRVTSTSHSAPRSASTRPRCPIAEERHAGGGRDVPADDPEHLTDEPLGVQFASPTRPPGRTTRTSWFAARRGSGVTSRRQWTARHRRSRPRRGDPRHQPPSW